MRLNRIGLAHFLIGYHYCRMNADRIYNLLISVHKGVI